MKVLDSILAWHEKILKPAARLLAYEDLIESHEKVFSLKDSQSRHFNLYPVEAIAECDLIFISHVKNISSCLPRLYIDHTQSTIQPASRLRLCR